MILVMLIVTATFQPAQPTVGDLITIDFAGPVRLEPSPDYEIVSQNGRRVVLRTFDPRPFAVSGVMGNVRFRNLVVPVKSVLAPKDDLEPAPLKPPRPVTASALPAAAIAVSALLAAAAWAGVIARHRRGRRPAAVEDTLPPAERFRATVSGLAENDWARLADATRLYLASLSPHLGVELTTTQLLRRVDAEHAGTIAAILRQGDYAKFSPWGAPPADFQRLAASALTLIREEPREAAA
jgi:hypothetical protein